MRENHQPRMARIQAKYLEGIVRQRRDVCQIGIGVTGALRTHDRLTGGADQPPFAGVAARQLEADVDRLRVGRDVDDPISMVGVQPDRNRLVVADAADPLALVGLPQTGAGVRPIVAANVGVEHSLAGRDGQPEGRVDHAAAVPSRSMPFIAVGRQLDMRHVLGSDGSARRTIHEPAGDDHALG